MKALYKALFSMPGEEAYGEVYVWADSEEEARVLAWLSYREHTEAPDYLSGLMSIIQLFDETEKSFATPPGGWILFGGAVSQSGGE